MLTELEKVRQFAVENIVTVDMLRIVCVLNNSAAHKPEHAILQKVLSIICASYVPD